jgi:hypothetical protein
MRKWLAVGTVALLALAVFLLFEIRSPDAAPAPHKKLTNDNDGLAVPTAMTAPIKPAVETPSAPADPNKVDVKSDRFAYLVEERAPNQVGRAAMKCYHPKNEASREHRHNKVVLGYKIRIKDGEVTFTDVKALESTLADKSLEACMLAEIAKTHWHNDKLPDYVEDDQTTLRPEDGGRKYRDIVDDDTSPVEKVKLTKPLRVDPRFEGDGLTDDQ